jgi:hypothetical protein
VSRDSFVFKAGMRLYHRLRMVDELLTFVRQALAGF